MAIRGISSRSCAMLSAAALGFAVRPDGPNDVWEVVIIGSAIIWVPVLIGLLWRLWDRRKTR